MIARWPGKIEPGTTTDHVSAFYDVMPTVAEITGTEPPEGIDGISFAPTLLGRPGEQKQHEFLYWEFGGYGGQQAVRMGKWKGVRQQMLRRNNPDPLAIELYDLEADIGESRDLADERPEVVDRIRKIMRQEHEPSAVFPMRPLDE
jgi:arylsulfatase